MKEFSRETIMKKFKDCKSAKDWCMSIGDVCTDVQDKIRDHSFIPMMISTALIASAIITQAWWLCWISVGICMFFVAVYAYAFALDFLFYELLWDYFDMKECFWRKMYLTYDECDQ